MRIITVKITLSIHQSTHSSTYLFVHLPTCLMPSLLACLSCLVCLLSEGKIRQGEVTGKSTCGRGQA